MVPWYSSWRRPSVKRFKYGVSRGGVKKDQGTNESCVNQYDHVCVHLRNHTFRRIPIVKFSSHLWQIESFTLSSRMPRMIVTVMCSHAWPTCPLHEMPLENKKTKKQKKSDENSDESLSWGLCMKISVIVRCLSETVKMLDRLVKKGGVNGERWWLKGSMEWLQSLLMLEVCKESFRKGFIVKKNSFRSRKGPGKERAFALHKPCRYRKWRN